MRNGRGGEDDRFSDHKLNITDRFVNKIISLSIPSVILSVKSVISPYDLSF